MLYWVAALALMIAHVDAWAIHEALKEIQQDGYGEHGRQLAGCEASASSSAGSCDGSCDSSCNSSCDYWGSWGCDSSCDGSCDNSCDSGCPCEGGDNLPSYLTKPKSQVGSGCIGRYDGDEFTLTSNVAEYSIVQSIEMWRGDERDQGGIAAIRIFFFDDPNPYLVGSTLGKTYLDKCTFQPGETLTDDLILSGNGEGYRLGYFKVTTSFGNTCEFNEDKEGNNDKYLFPTDGGFFGGLFGMADNEIYNAGPIVWKKIESVTVSNVAYPTLETDISAVSPDELLTQELCNDTPQPFESAALEYGVEYYTGSSTCFSLEVSFLIGQTYTFEASVEIPELGSATSTTETTWELQTTASFENCKEESETKTYDVSWSPVEVQPFTRVRRVLSQTRGYLENIPYTATVTIKQSGNTIVKDMQGEYNGARFTQLLEYMTGYEEGLQPGDCVGVTNGGAVASSMRTLGFGSSGNTISSVGGAASTPTWQPKAVLNPGMVPMHITVDGCGIDTSQQCAAGTATAAVRCCKTEANQCFDSICTEEQYASDFRKPLTMFDGTAATYDEAKAECTAQGMRLCTAEELSDEVCCGSGCGFDAKAVWSSSACGGSDRLELSPVKKTGVTVIDGKNGNVLECVTDPAATTTSVASILGGTTIAAQCCTLDDDCKRYVDTNNDEGCIAGYNTQGRLQATTYSAAYSECAARGMQLCDKPCNGQGCYYDHAPVWTRTACTAA